MNSTFVRKIMIDSRFRKTGVPGNFTFELNRAVTLPSKCAGFITDIELIHSWYTVDDHNEFLYFDEVYQDIGVLGLTQRVHKVALVRQNYTASDLASEIETKMNAVLENGHHTVLPTYNPDRGTITFSSVVGPSIRNAAGAWTRSNFTGSIIWTATGNPYEFTFTYLGST